MKSITLFLNFAVSLGGLYVLYHGVLSSDYVFTICGLFLIAFGLADFWDNAIKVRIIK